MSVKNTFHAISDLSPVIQISLFLLRNVNTAKYMFFSEIKSFIEEIRNNSVDNATAQLACYGLGMFLLMVMQIYALRVQNVIVSMLLILFAVCGNTRICDNVILVCFRSLPLIYERLN